MTWNDPLFITAGLTGISLVLVALFSKFFPPKEINDLYGYRTERSKQSQEVGVFAQEYANNVLFWIGLINLLFAILGLLIGLSVWLGLTISLTTMTASFIYLFKETEKQLKKKFGE